MALPFFGIGMKTDLFQNFIAVQTYLKKLPNYLILYLKQLEEAAIHMHYGILLRHKKEHIQVTANEVDEHRGYYTK